MNNNTENAESVSNPEPTPIPFDRAVALYYEEIKFALDNGTITAEEAEVRSHFSELNRHLAIGLVTGLIAPKVD